MPNYCIVCGLSRAQDPNISLYRIPKRPELQKALLEGLGLTQEDITADTRVCSMHFRDGNPKTIPSAHLGTKFAERPSKDTAREKRRASRESQHHHAKRLCVHTSSPAQGSPPPSPLPEPLVVSPPRSTPECSESSCSNVSVIQSEVGSSSYLSTPGSSVPTQSHSTEDLHVTVNLALVSQIEMLKSENRKLKLKLEEAKQAPFRVECIADNNSLVSLYTGFPSYDVLLSFYKFLGPAVENLQYWGTKPKTKATRRRMKLDPFNQLFTTLVKLKLDLNIRDIAIRFQVSTSTVSRYFITWVCFMYHELKEVPWFPSKRQIAGTLPYAFRERYPTRVAIIDTSEIFIETPSDLMLQSTAWSNYKHHNTFKFLIACTPNGAISFISSLYLGSVSDPALTQESGFFQKLEGIFGVSIMADRGFTIKESLAKIGIDLNLPPFMRGHAWPSSSRRDVAWSFHYITSNTC